MYYFNDTTTEKKNENKGACKSCKTRIPGKTTLSLNVITLYSTVKELWTPFFKL